MEIIIKVSELQKALQRVQGIVEKKTTMPVLANALIEAEKDTIRVSATDLEVALTGTYPATVKKKGALTLNARALYDMVRALPGDTVHLKETANHWVEIVSERVRYRVVGMASDNFPSLPDFQNTKLVPIDRDVFREMIDKTIYAVSNDDTRFNLTGVFFEPMAEGAGLRMAATDGHRLAVIERATPDKVPINGGVIVPRKGLMELRRLLEDGEDEGSLGFVENSAIFEKGNLRLTVRLIDGRFPDYRQVIPTSSAQRLEIQRKPFHDALKRTSLLSSDKAQGVRLEIADNTLSLISNNPDVGDAREDIEVRYNGDPLKVGFNVRYLMEALQVLDEESVVLELTDELAPGVILGKGTEGCKAVIMPMRI
jgi:DNA polymerase III subunit beta